MYVCFEGEDEEQHRFINLTNGQVFYVSTFKWGMYQDTYFKLNHLGWIPKTW